MDLTFDQYCFACGKDNPIGLKLIFSQEQDGVKAVFLPHREHQGFVNILHGGIISTLLDEAMANAIITAGYKAVTVRMELSFNKPTIVGTELTVTGKIELINSRLIKTSGQIIQNSQITAGANADFLIV
jgi:uncharacterized protein (TIGR00369 family)